MISQKCQPSHLINSPMWTWWPSDNISRKAILSSPARHDQVAVNAHQWLEEEGERWQKVKVDHPKIGFKSVSGKVKVRVKMESKSISTMTVGDYNKLNFPLCCKKSRAEK